MKVYLNTENLESVDLPLIEGIGLLRTEHLVFQGHNAKKHVVLLQKALLGLATEQDWFNLQYIHSGAIYDVLDDPRLASKPVHIRLFDPPIAEFLPPDDDDERQDFAELANSQADTVWERMQMVRENNPMMGLRGARLLIKNEQLLEMQLRAIDRACNAIIANKRDYAFGPPKVGIMVPMVSRYQEFDYIKEKIKKNCSSELQVGCMLETPASLAYVKILAKQADFLSFGTNDLTQFALGLSRDDSASIVADYLEKKILGHDPFVRLNLVVYQLMRTAMLHLKDMKYGGDVSVCGDHACDPASIALFAHMGIRSISIPPTEFERIDAWMKSETTLLRSY